MRHKWFKKNNYIGGQVVYPIHKWDRSIGAFFAVIIFLSIFTGFGMNFFITDKVHAFATYNQMTPSQEEQSITYFYALRSCIKYGVGNYSSGSTISSDNVASGAWFTNSGLYNPNVKIGYVLGNSSTNEYTCSDSGWINDAKNLWGYDMTDLFCKTGATRTNGTSCNGGQGDFSVKIGGGMSGLGTDEVLKSFTSNLESDLYDGQDPLGTLTGPANYVLYKNAFFSGCLGGQDIDNTYSGDANDDYLYKVTIAKENGTTQDVQYVSNDKKKSDSLDAFMNINGTSSSMSCEQISSSMSSYAQSMADWYYGATKDQIDTEANIEASITPTDNSKTTCAINGVGWIVCPIVNFLSNVADSAFNYLADSFLKIDTETVSYSSATYTAWGTMRNIANVAFVIVFLIVILSQVTGFGIDNYGIKKLLPKLIVTAVLVNLSFLLCQVAIDLSNIVGFSLNGFLSGLAPSIRSSKEFTATGNGFSSVASVLLAGGTAGVIVWANLAAFIAVLISAAIALLMILLMLIARKAIIVMLVVLAPLAFITFLLPNTEKIFKGWTKIFGTLLLLFPTIALVFGVSTFASKILQTVANQQNDGFGSIVAAAVLTLPLFAVPMLLKKSLDGIGNIGATINGLGGKLGGMANKGVRENFTDDMEKSIKARRNAKALNSQMKFNPRRALARGALRRQSILSSREAESNRAGAEYIAKATTEENSNLARQMAAGGGADAMNRVMARAVQASDKLDDEATQNAEILIRSKSNSADMIGDATKALNEAVISGDNTTAKAAANILLNSGGKGLDELSETIKSLEKTSGVDTARDGSPLMSVRNKVVKAGIKGKNAYLDTWSTGRKTLEKVMEEQDVTSGLNAVELAGQRMVVLNNAVNIGGITPEQKAAISNSDIAKGMLSPDAKRKLNIE